MQRKIKTEIKIQILREHLENQVPLADLAEKYHVNVNSILNWKKRLFESAVLLFDGTLTNKGHQSEEEREKAERELQAKDRVIAHLAEENLQLKKTFVGGH